MAQSQKKYDYPKWVRLLLGPFGLIAALLWGFAEGTLFFIVPDVLLTLTALFSLKKALQQAAFTVVGACLAGLILFSWSVLDRERARNTVMSVPYVNEEIHAIVQQHFNTYSITGSLLRGSFSGVPYKLYAIEAPTHTTRMSFTLATVPARAARFLCGIAFFALIGYWQRKRIRKNPFPALTGHGICWIIFYAIYWSSI